MSRVLRRHVLCISTCAVCALFVGQLGREVSVRLVLALELSRLDYCNAVLPGSSSGNTGRWSPAILVLDLKPRDRANSVLRELHWLPSCRVTNYKVFPRAQVPHWTASPICSHRSPTFPLVRHCAPPETANWAVNRRPGILCRCNSATVPTELKLTRSSTTI